MQRIFATGKNKSVFVGPGYADATHRNTLMFDCFVIAVCDCLRRYLVTLMKVLQEHKFWNNYEFSIWVNFMYVQKLHAMNSCKVFLFVLIIATIVTDSHNRRIKRQGKTVK